MKIQQADGRRKKKGGRITGHWRGRQVGAWTKKTGGGTAQTNTRKNEKTGCLQIGEQQGGLKGTNQNDGATVSQRGGKSSLVHGDEDI